MIMSLVLLIIIDDNCIDLVDMLKDKIENHLSIHSLPMADVKKPLKNHHDLLIKLMVNII